MSRSWPDRHTAVLAPHRVALFRSRGAWHPRLERVAEAACAGSSRGAALEALAGLLADPSLRRGRLSVVLSNQFVRYLLVPWRAEVAGPAELAGFAAICCDETFGEEPTGRVLVSARERAPSARVAAAIDTALLESLRAAAAASPLRLVSVQPYLGAAFDRLRRGLPRRDFMFLLAEPTRSCVLVASGGRWRSVRSTAGSNQPQALADLLEREAQLTGLADEGMPRVFVHAPGQHHLELPPCHGVVPRQLAWPGAVAGADAADPLLAMARAVA